MFSRIRYRLRTRRFGANTVVGIALSCLLAGLLVSSGLNRTLSVAAEDSSIAPQGSNGQPTATSPFTPLVEKLSSSVVNVKVSKVERADFFWP
jgi:hypothetical protein